MTTNDHPQLDELSTHAADLENNVGRAGRLLIQGLDRAVQMQTGAIDPYLDAMRRKNPDASPAEIQKMLDSHFLRLTTGSGGGVGVAAAVPGVGLITGTAAIAGESLIFLDAAAFYTVASARLRGVDIRDPERRRTLVLLAMLGSKGNQLVEAFVGDVGAPGKTGVLSAMTAVGKLSAPKLAPINNRLMRIVLKQFRRKLLRGWIGKLMPMGIGAVAGMMLNRRLSRQIIDNIGESLGATPAAFSTPVPEKEPKNSASEGSSDADSGRFARLWERIRPGKGKDAEPVDPLDEEIDRLALTAMTDEARKIDDDGTR